MDARVTCRRVCAQEARRGLRVLVLVRPGDCSCLATTFSMRFRAYSTASEAELSSDDDARRVDEEVGSASDASDDNGRRPPITQARRREDSPISEPSGSDSEDSDEEPEPRRRLTVQFDPAIKSPPPTQRQFRKLWYYNVDMQRTYRPRAVTRTCCIRLRDIDHRRYSGVSMSNFLHGVRRDRERLSEN